jgi:hypothetical protein
VAFDFFDEVTMNYEIVDCGRFSKPELEARGHSGQKFLIQRALLMIKLQVLGVSSFNEVFDG